MRLLRSSKPIHKRTLALALALALTLALLPDYLGIPSRFSAAASLFWQKLAHPEAVLCFRGSPRRVSLMKSWIRLFGVLTMVSLVGLGNSQSFSFLKINPKGTYLRDAQWEPMPTKMAVDLGGAIPVPV